MESSHIVIKYISRLRENIETLLTKRIEKTEVKGLVSSHGNILVQLYEEDKQAMSKIAARIGRCKSTLTVLVDKLEKIGFITREADSYDTRIKKLCLTEKGKEFQEVFWNISDELNSLLWKGFTSEEQKILLNFLERMNKNIQEQSTECTECNTNKQLNKSN